MGRKKSTAVVKPGFRPFCFYCDRDFDNEKVLIQHQKLKHFQCYICHRKSDTARGLVGHMLQVHKESMPKVPNAIVGREDPELAIHGLEGVPNHLVASRAKGTLYEDELARRRALENAPFSSDTVTSFHHMVASVGPPPTFASHFPFPPPTSGTPLVTASGMLVQPQHFSFPGIIPPPPPLQPRSHPTLTDTKDGEKSNQGATSNVMSTLNPDEQYPTPQKYLDGAAVPKWYSFQSNLVTDADLKPGMLRQLEVDKRLTLPTRTHIRFLITAADVLHSWSVPSLGIKCDATPGRINKVHCFIQREGVYYGQCSELCGALHAYMPIVVEAVAPEVYAAHAKKWYRE